MKNEFFCTEFYNESGGVDFVVCPIDAEKIEDVPNMDSLYDAFEGMENGEAWWNAKQIE